MLYSRIQVLVISIFLGFCLRLVFPSCAGNLIVAGATDYTIRDVRTFLLSYNVSQTSQNSKLLLLFSESQRKQELLQKFLQIFRINLEIVYISSTQHVGNFRFHWLKEYLLEQERSGTRYCTVFSTDIRDVYFQADDLCAQIDSYRRVNDIDPASSYVILSQEGVEGGKRMIDCEYHVEAATRACMKANIRDYDSFMKNKIICSGAIIGSTQGMIELLTLMLTMLQATDRFCLAQSMTDQVILNLVVYESTKDKLKVYIPDNFYSPMLTMGYVPTDYFSLKRSKQVFAEKSDLGVAIISIDPSHIKDKQKAITPAYVHQYDRFPEIRRMINFGLGCGNLQYYGDSGQYTGSKNVGGQETSIKRKRSRPREDKIDNKVVLK
jgi:hypothetical protein